MNNDPDDPEPDRYYEPDAYGYNHHGCFEWIVTMAAIYMAGWFAWEIWRML